MNSITIRAVIYPWSTLAIRPDLAGVWLGALALSLIGTLPLSINDDRQGKRENVGIAVVLLLAGCAAAPPPAIAPAKCVACAALP